jgi:hypothetical protein
MKRLLILAGFLAAVAVGAAVGYLVGRHRPRGAGLAGNPAEAGPDWKEWKYPGGAEHDSSLGGGGQIGTAGVPPHYCLAMTTEDDYEKVLRFYADKPGMSGLAAGTGSGMKGGASTDPNTSYIETWFVLNDGWSPEGVSRGRPVKVKVFGKRTGTYDLTMHVSRASDEKHTHIVLAYYPKR